MTRTFQNLPVRSLDTGLKCMKCTTKKKNNLGQRI